MRCKKKNKNITSDVYCHPPIRYFQWQTHLPVYTVHGMEVGEKMHNANGLDNDIVHDPSSWRKPRVLIEQKEISKRTEGYVKLVLLSFRRQRSDM